MTKTATYIDPATGHTFPLDTPLWRSPEGNPLMISELPGITENDIVQGERSLWRYQKALPLKIEHPVTLGEGLTPLLSRDMPSGTLHFKLEWFAPTGSFKDRGAAVMMSYLRQAGVDEILEDSSGNGGAAMAAYGAAAGIKVRILTPATTQAAKISQMLAFGAEVQLVSGPREESENEAIRQSAETFYASHNWQAFFLQGTKLLAYELWEDFGFKAPDTIVIPVGAGSNVLGLDIGFNELLKAGQIEELPRLICAQPANCAPIHAAFQAGATTAVPTETKPTIAEGTAIKKPVRLKQVLEAIRRSQGQTIAVSEQQIENSVRKLAQMGLYVEPTSALAAAAAERLLASGHLRSDDENVVLLTGSGLKASSFMTGLFSK